MQWFTVEFLVLYNDEYALEMQNVKMSLVVCCQKTQTGSDSLTGYKADLTVHHTTAPPPVLFGSIEKLLFLSYNKTINNALRMNLSHILRIWSESTNCLVDMSYNGISNTWLPLSYFSCIYTHFFCSCSKAGFLKHYCFYWSLVFLWSFHLFRSAH